jgi:hypothetical protein
MRLQVFAILLFAFTASMGFARDYIIYSIAQDVPMGHENEIVKKNFYVNMGAQQGVNEGTVLDVFRTISRLDPYESKKRYNYKVKIGELTVIHTEDNSAIGKLNKFQEGEEVPYFEIDGLMIGDRVNVHITQ